MKVLRNLQPRTEGHLPVLGAWPVSLPSSHSGRIPVGQCPSLAGDGASHQEGLSGQQGTLLPASASFCGIASSHSATLDLAGVEGGAAVRGGDPLMAHNLWGLGKGAGTARTPVLCTRTAHGRASGATWAHKGKSSMLAAPSTGTGATAWASAGPLVAGTRPWAAPSSLHPRAAPTPWEGGERCGSASTSPSALLFGK